MAHSCSDNRVPTVAFEISHRSWNINNTWNIKWLAHERSMPSLSKACSGRHETHTCLSFFSSPSLKFWPFLTHIFHKLHNDNHNNRRNAIATVRLLRRDSTEENSLITCRKSAQWSENFLSISTQSEFSRKYNPSLDTNEVNLIRTKLEDSSHTLYIRYIWSTATFAEHSQSTNQKKTIKAQPKWWYCNELNRPLSENNFPIRRACCSLPKMWCYWWLHNVLVGHWWTIQ